MDPIQRINQAFLQLEFSIKLMNYIELGHIDKEQLDSDTTVLLERRNLSFPDNSFSSYDDIIIAAQNNYIITLGNSAIALETSLQEGGIHNDPKDTSPRGQLRTLVYMIRCAFAHDMMTPSWNIKPQYRRVLEIDLPTGKIDIDLQNLNGKPFDDKHIGGIETYYELKDSVVEFLKA